METKEKQKEVDQKDLENKVKDMYRKVALHPEQTYHFEMGRDLAERLGYPAQILDQIPASAIDSFAGVGYFFELADLKKGESVVDLGSGSGMDVFFAALKVGKTGEVIGIDMTTEQLRKAEHLSKQHDFQQVIFHPSYIEDLPVRNGSIDAVISNGVINLSADKAKVFREAGRILKNGGRLVISDIVSLEELPQTIKCNATLWAACIGGAMQLDSYRQLIHDAGLEITHINDNPYSFISKSALGAIDQYGIKSVSIHAVKK